MKKTFTIGYAGIIILVILFTSILMLGSAGSYAQTSSVKNPPLPVSQSSLSPAKKPSLPTSPAIPISIQAITAALNGTLTGTSTASTTTTASAATSTTASSTDLTTMQNDIKTLQDQVANMQKQIQELYKATGATSTVSVSDPRPTNRSVITLSPSRGTFSAGSLVDFNGRNFSREQQISVTVDGQNITTTHADGGGNFSTGYIRLPFVSGDYTFTFTGTSGEKMTSTITVK